MKLGVGRGSWIVGGLVVALVGARIALPYVVKDFVNRTLAENPQYTGHIDDVDISLVRGAYVIEGLRLQKIDGEAPVPFLDVPVMDLSVAWGALLDGAVVAEVELHGARLNFVNGDRDAEDQAGTGVVWQDEVQKLVPIRIDRFAVVDGEVHYADVDSKPPIDVFLEHLELEAVDLTNRQTSGEALPATVEATAVVLEAGTFHTRVRLDPFAELPTFDLNVEVEGVPLAGANDLLRGYGRVDAEGGTLDLFAELASNDGRFAGYVKPVLTDARVFRLADELDDGDGPARLAWEALVGLGKELLENDREKRVATKVQIDGAYDDPDVETWSAVWSSLHNAFVEALFKGIDGDVTFASVGGEVTVSPEEQRAEKQAARARRREERQGR